MVRVTKYAFDVEDNRLLSSYENFDNNDLDKTVARIQRLNQNTIILDKTQYAVVIKNRDDDIAHLWVLIKLN